MTKLSKEVSREDNRRIVCAAIFATLEKDPEAFSDFSKALNEGIRSALEIERSRANRMYDAMINTFILTSKGNKVPADLKKLFAERIVGACHTQYGCEAEKTAAKTFAAIAQMLEKTDD